MYKNTNNGNTKVSFYRSLNEMHFIGIFANHKEYENIKKNVIKILKEMI